jgi:hypothetical protein
MEHVEPRARARSEVRAKADFYWHLSVYVAVNLLLVVINLVTWPGYFWAAWPLLGWGIGVAAHALRVFVLDRNGRHHRAPHGKAA